MHEVTSTSVRIRKDFHEWVKSEAKRRDRSFSWVLNHLIFEAKTRIGVPTETPMGKQAHQPGMEAQ